MNGLTMGMVSIGCSHGPQGYHLSIEAGCSVSDSVNPWAVSLHQASYNESELPKMESEFPKIQCYHQLEVLYNSI